MCDGAGEYQRCHLGALVVSLKHRRDTEEREGVERSHELDYLSLASGDFEGTVPPLPLLSKLRKEERLRLEGEKKSKKTTYIFICHMVTRGWGGGGRGD